MPLTPWHTSGPSRAIDPSFGLRLSDEHLAPLVLPPWKRSALHGHTPLIPWHSSGPSRALDPYVGLRLSDEHLAPELLTPWERRLRRLLQTNMSLIPWHTSGPSHSLDPYFGTRLGDEEILDPLTMAPWEGNFRPFRSYSWDTLLPSESGSTAKKDKDRFEVNIDVQHFKPNEIKVTLSGDTVIIECKHVEKPDEHGYILRHFVRRYAIPEDYDLSKVKPVLSSDGVLSIIAPKINADGNEEKTIPIQYTGNLKGAIKYK